MNNDENNQINKLAKTRILQLMGICKAFKLENKHKGILFGSLTGTQCKIIDSLLAFPHSMDEIQEKIASFGEIKLETATIIDEMLSLVESFRFYNVAQDAEWQGDFIDWIYAVQFKDYPYKGGSFMDYITMPGLDGAAPTSEDIVDRLYNLRIFELAPLSLSDLDDLSDLDKYF